MWHSGAYEFYCQLPVEVKLDIDFANEVLDFVVNKNRNLFHIHALIGYRTMTSSADADAWVLVQKHFQSTTCDVEKDSKTALRQAYGSVEAELLCVEEDNETRLDDAAADYRLEEEEEHSLH